MVGTILITGSDGFVGKNLIDFYINKYNILTLTKKDNIENILNKKPDIIINAAASIYDNESMFSTNVLLVNHIVEYVKKFKSKFIQIGSSAEYGKVDRASKENDPLNPLTFYAGTKAAATMICKSAAIDFDLPIVVARPYSLYGNYEKSYRLFSKLFEAFTNNAKMILSDGYHDFIYIKDFIDGIDKLIHGNYHINGDIINFGTGVQTSNFEVLSCFIDFFGFKPDCITINNDLAKSFESKTWVCDTTYAKERYSFIPKYSLKDGIADLLSIKGIK
jgi:nucleoside-diphosphate-sugar epimerase